MTIQTTARNATLSDLATLLQEQHARKVDIVAPASKIRSEGGVLVVQGAAAEITAEGVTATDGRYRPTAIADEGVAEKLGIPVSYVRRMREQRPDLYDANVNGWLHGTTAWKEPQELVASGDPRSFLLRCFRGDDADGLARAFLSDSYRVIDNLDVLTAALDGVRQAGVEVEIDGCDLTERRMQVRIVAPSVTALAPVLLRDYRSPFRDASIDALRRHDAAGAPTLGHTPSGDPIVFAGFALSNSETGGGAFSITPRLVVQVCRNGMTVNADALRAVHVGGRLDEGLIRWTEDTQRKSLSLITAKTRDAVATFLDVDYMTRVIARVEEQAGVALAKPTEVVQTVGKRLAFDQGTIDGVLDHFLRGGQTTAGGVLAAVTSYAQTVADPDKASEIESQALRALELATVAG